MKIVVTVGEDKFTVLLNFQDLIPLLRIYFVNRPQKFLKPICFHQNN